MVLVIEEEEDDDDDEEEGLWNETVLVLSFSLEGRS